MTPCPLRGLIAAVFTPFDAAGELNLAIVPEYVEYLLEAGVAGAFVCGTTGEGLSLSTAERREVAAAWVTAARGRLPVVVHVGHNSLPEARTLAAHAAAIGAPAIAAQAPMYFKPATIAALAEFLARVASAAPSTPFYYYDIPALTGVALATDRVLESLAERVDTLAGVKFTNHDLLTLQACRTVLDGRLNLLFGYDEMLLAGLAFGADGAIGSTYNAAAPVYRRVLDAFARGDLAEARRAQRVSVDLVRVLVDFGVVRAGKQLMAGLGVDCGPVRSPLTPLTDDETARLYARLDDAWLARPLRRGG